MTDAEIAEMYYRVKRTTTEGSLAEAIRLHAQACGLVAFVLNVHPDEVARAVADQRRPAAAVEV